MRQAYDKPLRHALLILRSYSYLGRSCTSTTTPSSLSPQAYPNFNPNPNPNPNQVQRVLDTLVEDVQLYLNQEGLYAAL